MGWNKSRIRFLYGCEIWVVTDVMMVVMGGFRHRVAWMLAVLEECRDNDSDWEWTSVATALEETGLWKIL